MIYPYPIHINNHVTYVHHIVQGCTTRILKESALLAEQERHQREDPGTKAGTELLKNGLFMVFTIKTLEKMVVNMV